MDICNNYKNIKESIPQMVKLISVSKTRPIEDLMEVYNAGARDFGENKAQELRDKFDYMPKDIRWHFIGHLQKNKVKYLVDRVDLIHSLDSIPLLLEIEKQFGSKNKVANVLIEINIGREESKTGIFVEEVDELLTEVEKCSFVKVKGIMVIIPKGDENSCRKYFKEAKGIWCNLKNKKYKNVEMEELSMGMTNDYKLAIDEGSTIVRIGEGIFGKRNYNKSE